MTILRPAEERGHANHGWLDTHFSFSFADYYDPKHMGFRSLRVINEDRVAPSKGFGMHPHRDMEIITYILEGELAHKDSMGTGSSIRPGEVQRMSAGTGVMHSEFNYTEPVHLLQIWIMPDENGIPPSYEEKTFPAEQKRNQLRLIASPDAQNGSLTIHQDAKVYATVLERDKAVRHELGKSRGAWVQVARGEISLNGNPLHAGDGAAVEGETAVEMVGKEKESEVLLFDLA
jgi:redox-sensitive bicupin YhaK (pirin superfamily)